MQELTRYWATEHDWRTLEAKLNALPQFTTEIDGLGIHFIHVKSPHENALPVIITHGWPGSVIEMLGTVGPLTDPTAHGGTEDDAFDVVIPSIPGYGFSAQPAEVGWDPGRTAAAWAALMQRLGYTRYVAQGGDVGASITTTMGRLAPEGLLGIHLNFLVSYPPEIAAAAFGGAPAPTGLSDEESAALAAITAAFRRGYIVEQSEHPQTIGYSLADSPAGLAAWMLDHDAGQLREDLAGLSRWSTLRRPHAGECRRQHVAVLADEHRDLGGAGLLGVRTSRRCRRRGRATAATDGAPGGVLGVPRRALPGTAQLGGAGLPQPHLLQRGRRGGHFAAWEEPELFASELRSAFSSLR